MRDPRVVGWLLAAFALALGLRSLGVDTVLVDPETVVLPPGDAQYHFRRALFGWVNFPEVIFFDPYINHPGGAAISWPPFFDFLISGLGRLVAADEQGFARRMVWAPPVIGALALLPVFAIARRIGGDALGIGAAFLMALLPTSVQYSRVGQLDHHCLVALIGACLLLVLTRIADEERPSPTLAWQLGAGLAAGRIAMLLSWHGSLLYLALVEATLWIAAALTGRRGVYALQAGSAAAAVLVVGPLVWLFPEPLGGPWSAIGLSRLHVTSMLAVAVVSGGMWMLERRAWTRTPTARLAATGALGVAFALVVLVLPATREGLLPGLRFLALEDGVGERTIEQLPLFQGLGRPTGLPVWAVWGGLGYALPLLPLAVAWVAFRRLPEERRAGALVVAGWCAAFGALAITQRRYGNDLGPAAAVGFALVIAQLARGRASSAGRSRGFARAAPVLLTLVLLLPPAALGWLPGARRVALWWTAEPVRDPALGTPAGTLTRFLETVRAVTPDTAGYFDLAREPEYGIVSQANFGHAIQNVARRATPTDPFWSFIGVENWDAAFGLLGARDEEQAFALARRLRGRYVLTHSSADADTVEGWLHFGDGLAFESWPASGHFRLVAEGPQGGAHFSQRFQVAPGERITGPAMAPYKLFEVVEGAVLLVAATPGEEVVASVELVTPAGRSQRYTSRARADSDGRARIRVPYATRGSRDGAAQARGPYQVRTGGQRLAVAVPETAVQQGREVPVGGAPPGRSR